MRPENLSLTYIIGSYPSLTMTFIDREITALRQMGVHLRILSIRRPWTELSKDQKALQKEIIYLLPLKWLSLVGGHVRYALWAPGCYFGTLLYLLTRSHRSIKARLMTLLHFLEGVYAANVLRKNPGDHLHAHFIDRSATVALVASRLLKIPYSVTAHANDIYVSPVLLVEKLAEAKFVATCTAYNQAYLQRIGSGLFDHKLICIYHGIDAVGYRRSRPAPIGKPIILSVGRLIEKKGFRYLLDACRVLNSRKVDFECRIIGEGPQRGELERLVRELCLTDCVILCGAMPQDEVIIQYEQATIFALPATLGSDGDRDGIPNVILEAMAMELPVVSTRHSGVPEVVVDGVNGLLVPINDVESLADALIRLINDTDQRQRLGKAGKQTVMRQFDPETNVRKLLAAFQGNAT